ncbi:MAG: 2-C-methyl-D-erythritol 4-phosphate cytidylyltransferase [Actinomycetota bacterium]|nr:2-C-methyl-D-erythritol 4-phosphate cytidylyltransferase [Actinomycetota bacterium]
MTAAILAAAGAGERAASADPLPKQFRLLAGRPLISWSLDVLRSVCDPVVVAVPADHIDDARSLLDDGVVITAGGATRQESVMRALDEITSEQVIVHDAARPFVTKELVTAVIDALDDVDGAIAVVPVQDTVKRVEQGRIVETLDRDGLCAAQTPQAFKTAVLREAHEAARRAGYHATDDAQLIEWRGGRVAVVEGSPLNIKITAASDFDIAEALARR